MNKKEELAKYEFAIEKLKEFRDGGVTIDDFIRQLEMDACQFMPQLGLGSVSGKGFFDAKDLEA